MSEGLRPASAIALSAASACSSICDMSGMTPSSVVSAAPTMAMDFGFIVHQLLRRTEQRQRDLVVELLERDLERHVELQRLGRLRAVDDVGHHARPLVELDHGDRVGRREAGHRPVVDDVAVEPALAAGLEHRDLARGAGRAERARREIGLARRRCSAAGAVRRPACRPRNAGSRASAVVGRGRVRASMRSPLMGDPVGPRRRAAKERLPRRCRGGLDCPHEYSPSQALDA